jgi:hypothetical protein
MLAHFDGKIRPKYPDIVLLATHALMCIFINKRYKWTS